LRILTRIFLSFWLAAVLIAAAAVGVTVLNFATDHRNPEVVTRQATEVLQSEGVEGLRVWLKDRNARYDDQRTLIVDERGQELLGQRMPRWGWRPPPREGQRPSGPGSGPGPRPEFGQPPMGPPGFGPGGADRPSPSHQQFSPRPRGTRLEASDGTTYWLMFDPPPRRGPFSPPFSWGVRFMLMAVALAISGLVSYLLARTISKPLETLQATARDLSTGNLAVRTPTGVARRSDEVGVLARELDSMAERLGALISARQQLLRDISHELRSPLARLQMAVGLGKQDVVRAADQLGRIEREAENLEALIASILEYARLERDPATLQLEEVDLVELLRRILHDAQFESQCPPDRLRFTHPDHVMLRADPVVLHAALDNVVRNALLHGGPEPAIEVSLTVAGSEVCVEVRDHGPGVPEGELDKIFEPFHRALSASAHVTGSGIGLAITARAAALHGGRVTARNAADGGLIVRMVFARGVAEEALRTFAQVLGTDVENSNDASATGR